MNDVPGLWKGQGAGCRASWLGWGMKAMLFAVFFTPPVFALAAQPLVIVATYEGVINPVSAEYLHDAVAFAEEKKAELLVFQLDTPGGLDTSMRLMIKDITTSQIPVGVFVSPSGGRAASAGVYITLAAHVAAMAPGTNIGAAHPVALGGGEMDKVMKEKVENGAVAYAKSIAERRGRNVTWAEDAVRKSISATGTEALKLNIIDLVASDLDDLLKQLDGQEVMMGAQPVALHTKDADIQEFSLSWRLEVLKALSDPNIAYVLMNEHRHARNPCRIVQPWRHSPRHCGRHQFDYGFLFISLQSLPVNYAGVLLLLPGIVLFVLEITVTSYGLLAMGGWISMILGSLMLMKHDLPFYKISLAVIVPVVAIAAGFTLLVVSMGVKALRSRSVTGSEGMVGLVGLAKTDLAPEGKIVVHGEIWDAVSPDQSVQAGSRIEVTGVHGLTLHPCEACLLTKGVPHVGSVIQPAVAHHLAGLACDKGIQCASGI